MKTKRFTVEGFGAFPVDMLRYDACYPADSVSATLINGRGRRAVNLRSYREPTIGRWNSFMWTVKEN